MGRGRDEEQTRRNRTRSHEDGQSPLAGDDRRGYDQARADGGGDNLRLGMLAAFGLLGCLGLGAAVLFATILQVWGDQAGKLSWLVLALIPAGFALAFWSEVKAVLRGPQRTQTNLQTVAHGFMAPALRVLAAVFGMCFVVLLWREAMWFAGGEFRISEPALTGWALLGSAAAWLLCIAVAAFFGGRHGPPGADNAQGDSHGGRRGPDRQGGNEWTTDTYGSPRRGEGREQ